MFTASLFCVVFRISGVLMKRLHKLLYFDISGAIVMSCGFFENFDIAKRGLDGDRRRESDTFRVNLSSSVFV